MLSHPHSLPCSCVRGPSQCLGSSGLSLACILLKVASHLLLFSEEQPIVWGKTMFTKSHSEAPIASPQPPNMENIPDVNLPTRATPHFSIQLPGPWLVIYRDGKAQLQDQGEDALPRPGQGPGWASTGTPLPPSMALLSPGWPDPYHTVVLCLPYSPQPPCILRLQEVWAHRHSGQCLGR